jgi:hypothetical protein
MITISQFLVEESPKKMCLPSVRVLFAISHLLTLDGLEHERLSRVFGNLKRTPAQMVQPELADSGPI